MFENRALREIVGHKRDDVTGEWRKLPDESFMVCTAYQILFG